MELLPVTGIENIKNSGEERQLDVDHNHETGQVRGLICRSCNTLVGYTESGALYLALDYLKRFNSSGNRT